VAEVGCGDAFGTRIVQQEVDAVTPYDFDPVFIRDIRRRQSAKWPLPAQVHDILEGPLPHQYDAIYTLDVIEHIPAEKEDTFICNLWASLADHGVLIIGSPSLEFFPIDVLDGFCRYDSILGGHPEAAKVPGVEASTGALGHGLPIGMGRALGLRMKGLDARVFVITGDGEINEGSVWEAALSCSKHRLSNLAVMIDYNKIQSAGATREILDLEPLADKWRSFGFATTEVDGHDVGALRQLLRQVPLGDDRPTAIICHTVKGKGITFTENDADWHHKSSLKADVITDMYAALGMQ